MKAGAGKHNRARERLQQKAAANRAARLAPGVISENSSPKDVQSGGAFRTGPIRARSTSSLRSKFTPIQRVAYVSLTRNLCTPDK